jgi:uncharacterized protein
VLDEGIRLFNDGRFFECHEVLEEIWTLEHGPRRLFFQAVIHIAVGFYHCQRGNSAGARGQLGKALRKLGPYLPCYEGIDTARLHEDVLALIELIEAGSPVLKYPQIHRVPIGI